MIATFIGHRKIQNCEILTTRLKETIIRLIDDKQVDTFCSAAEVLSMIYALKQSRKCNRSVHTSNEYISELLIHISTATMKHICSNSMMLPIFQTKSRKQEKPLM